MTNAQQNVAFQGSSARHAYGQHQVGHVQHHPPAAQRHLPAAQYHPSAAQYHPHAAAAAAAAAFSGSGSERESDDEAASSYADEDDDEQSASAQPAAQAHPANASRIGNNRRARAEPSTFTMPLSKKPKQQYTAQSSWTQHASRSGDSFHTDSHSDAYYQENEQSSQPMENGAHFQEHAELYSHLHHSMQPQGQGGPQSLWVSHDSNSTSSCTQPDSAHVTRVCLLCLPCVLCVQGAARTI